MGALEAIKRRRSIREFSDESISKEILTEVLDAARGVPTTSNQQRRRFIVITDPRVKEMIKKVSPAIFALWDRSD